MPKSPFDHSPRPILLGVVLLLFLGIFPNQGFGHRVTIFAWVDGATVHTQSRFPGGRAVQNGAISVYHPNGELLFTGKTDTSGEFDFKLPEKVGVRIVLDAGMGHGNEWVLSTEDVLSVSNHDHDVAPSADKNKTASETPKGNDIIALSREEVKAIIDESIDKKMKPLMKTIADLHTDRPSITDILSGIGYILGLVGVGAYVHSRKKR